MPVGVGDDMTPGFAMPAQAGETVELDPTQAPAFLVEDVVPEGPPGSLLEIKYLHEIHDVLKNQWMIRPAPPQTEDGQGGGRNDAQKYAVYAFTVIRRFVPTGQFGAKTYNVTTFLEIHSAHLVESPVRERLLILSLYGI